MGWVTYGSSRLILVGLGNLRFLQVNQSHLDAKREAIFGRRYLVDIFCPSPKYQPNITFVTRAREVIRKFYFCWRRYILWYFFRKPTPHPHPHPHPAAFRGGQLGGGGSSLAAAQLRRRQRGGSTATAVAVAAWRQRRQLGGSAAAAAAAGSFAAAWRWRQR